MDDLISAVKVAVNKTVGLPIVKMATNRILQSPIKVAYYHLHGAKIGGKVKIGVYSIIDSKSIEIGDGSKIGFRTFIRSKSVSIGKQKSIHWLLLTLGFLN